MAKNKNSLSDEKLKSAAGGSSVEQRDDEWYVFDEELDDQVSQTFDKKEDAYLFQKAYDDGKDKGFWDGYELGHSEGRKNS